MRLSSPIPAQRGKHAALAFLFALLLTGAAPLAHAAAPHGMPDSGAAMREAQQARPVPPPRREDTGIDGTRPPLSSDVAGGTTTFVREFRLEQIEYVPEADIQAVLAPYTGRELTMLQLEEAMSKVTELYRQRGYSTARAYLPRQKAEGGVITLRVLVGKYGATRLENKSLVRDGFIEKILSGNLTPGQPVQHADLERAVLLIGDLPGAALPALNMAPGEAKETSDFFVEVPEGKRFSGYLMSDNYGSRHTGRGRFGGGVDINSPFGIGDKLSVYALTTDNNDLTNQAINYSFPLAANGLRLNLGYSHVYYELDGSHTYRDLDANGWADTYEGTFSYPVIRSSSQNLYANLNLAHKKMHDSIDAFVGYPTAKKHSNVAKVGLQYERWNNVAGRPVFTQFNGSLTYGKLSLSADLRDGDKHGADKRGDFSYANLGVLTQISLAEKWNLSLAASGQQAFGKNLDGSEQFSTTGTNGVKAYRESVSGDSGYLLNAELRYTLPAWTDGLNHSVGAFIDHGGWRYEKHSHRYTNPEERRSDTLTGIGIGYYVNYDRLSAKVQLNHATGHYPDYPGGLKKESRTHLMAQLIVPF